MVLLRNKADWFLWILDLGFSEEDTKKYAASLTEQSMSEADLPVFNHEVLKSCSINKYAHRVKIISKALGLNLNKKGEFSQTQSNVLRPYICRGITETEFDQFIRDWKEFKKHYRCYEKEEAERQLMFCCTKDLRDAIYSSKNKSNSYSTETELLQAVKDVALQKAPHMVQVEQFLTTKQEQNESCEDYLSRLEVMANSCKFKCKHCNKSTEDERVKEKFLLGLFNQEVKADLLEWANRKPGVLLSKLVEEAVISEPAVCKTMSLSENDDKSSEVCDTTPSTSGEESSSALSKPNIVKSSSTQNSSKDSPAPYQFTKKKPPIHQNNKRNNKVESSSEPHLEMSCLSIISYFPN